VAATIAQAATDLGYTRIEIGWEATGMLWIPFYRYLSTDPLLQSFELDLVCFNPKLVAKFKDGLVLRGPKNDDRDAFDIAARLRFGELPVSYVPSDFWQGLRRLTRYRYRLSRALSQEKMRFQSYAFLKCGDWKRVQAFSDLFGATSVALLTEFTVAELHQMTHDQLVDLISLRGRGRFDDPTATARAVRRALATSSLRNDAAVIPRARWPAPPAGDSRQRRPTRWARPQSPPQRGLSAIPAAERR
jgi:hypothetical protein